MGKYTIYAAFCMNSILIRATQIILIIMFDFAKPVYLVNDLKPLLLTWINFNPNI